MSDTAAARVSRWLLSLCLAVATVLGLVGLAGPAAASTPASVDVVCTSAVSYGGEVDCLAASLDSDGNYGVPGTFTFDPDHVLPATWSSARCAVNGAACNVIAEVATPAGAADRSVTFEVDFAGADGSTAVTMVTVALSLQQTVTTVTCDQTDLPVGGVAHCVMSAVNLRYDGYTWPASLPDHVSGLSASSSAGSDALSYDAPSADGSTCVATVVDGALQCGFTVAPATRGVRTVTAEYGGDPATDEAPSAGTVAIANGPRVAPVVTVGCPASVPAAAPQTTCTVSVAGPAAGDPVPSGTVEIDQAADQPLPFDSGFDCTLIDGSCAIPYEIFEGSPSDPAPPVRALYSGDDSYLPGSASQVVAVDDTASVAAMTCDSATPGTFTAMHCELRVSTADGHEVPVAPLDTTTIATTSGSISCDVPANVGCGHTDAADAIVVGFTLRVGKTAGSQSVTGTYSGDDYALVAGSTATFAFSAVAPVSSDAPPVLTVVKAATTTTVSCGPAVAYRHDARCVVTVKAPHGGSPTGTVRVAPIAGAPTFTARSCTLSASGQCAVAVTLAARPGSSVPVSATYAGSDGFLGSAGPARIAVRPVATTVTVRCSHTAIGVGSVVHCIATVRTEFGAAAAAPVPRKSQVTVTAHGDVVSYAGGSSCHWVRSGDGLTCAFSVKAGPVRGGRTIHVYYTGDHASQDAASRGQMTITVSRRS